MSEDNMQHPEVPVIIIERDDEPKASFWHNTVALTVAAIGILGVLSMAVLASLYIGYKVYNEDHIGVPISVTPAQNIEKLKGHLQKETAEVMIGDIASEVTDSRNDLIRLKFSWKYAEGTEWMKDNNMF